MDDDNALVTAIVEAFPMGVPPQERVAPHACDECHEVTRLIQGRTWMDVGQDFPSYCHDVYPLLSDAAKRYYLPAWMLAAIRDRDSFAGDSLIYSLSDGAVDPAHFTPQQRSAVLRWVATRADADDDRRTERIRETWR